MCNVPKVQRRRIEIERKRKRESFTSHLHTLICSVSVFVVETFFFYSSSHFTRTQKCELYFIAVLFKVNGGSLWNLYFVCCTLCTQSCLRVCRLQLGLFYCHSNVKWSWMSEQVYIGERERAIVRVSISWRLKLTKVWRDVRVTGDSRREQGEVSSKGASDEMQGCSNVHHFTCIITSIIRKIVQRVLCIHFAASFILNETAHASNTMDSRERVLYFTSELEHSERETRGHNLHWVTLQKLYCASVAHCVLLGSRGAESSVWRREEGEKKTTTVERVNRFCRRIFHTNWMNVQHQKVHKQIL